LPGRRLKSCTSPLNLPAPGRRQTPSVLSPSPRRPVFLVNSRHPLVCAPPPRLPRLRALLSRSYEGNLPSSFSTVLSSALVYSTSPPVSVSGTVTRGGSFLGPPGCKGNPLSPHSFRDPSPTAGWGILTPFPSATPLGLALGAGSP